MSNTEIQKPRIHLNGSGKKSLREGYENAYAKLNEALEALVLCRPHGRDYYPIANEHAFKIARDQHTAREKALGSVLDDLAELCCHVEDAAHG